MDDEAPEIIIEESDGDTRVVELTDNIPLGIGNTLGVHPEFDVLFAEPTYITTSVTRALDGDVEESQIAVSYTHLTLPTT